MKFRIVYGFNKNFSNFFFRTNLSLSKTYTGFKSKARSETCKKHTSTFKILSYSVKLALIYRIYYRIFKNYFLNIPI